MRKLYKLAIILLCSLSIRAQVAPIATIVTTSPLHCTGIPITFSAASTATVPLSYTWSIVPLKGLTQRSDNMNGSTISLTSTTTINYTIQLIVSNDLSIDTTVITMQPNRIAKASFNASFSNNGYPTDLFLTNYSSNSIKTYWQFNDASVPDSTTNAVKRYTQSGSYRVSLIAFGNKGCNDTSDYAFRISDSSSVILPNVFSPNGDDANDVYRPVTTGISSMKAWIYNRDGLLVSSWDKVRGFWDGHSTAGEECDAGTYFIILEAIGFDGKDYKLKSTITLVR